MKIPGTQLSVVMILLALIGLWNWSPLRVQPAGAQGGTITVQVGQPGGATEELKTFPLFPLFPLVPFSLFSYRRN